MGQIWGGNQWCWGYAVGILEDLTYSATNGGQKNCRRRTRDVLHSVSAIGLGIGAP